MEKFNELVVLIQAFQNACKDFHYFCNSYSLHLLADEINSDDLYDIVDSIKENVFIANGQNPLKAKEYAEKVATKTPELKKTDKENLEILLGLANETRNLVNSIKTEERAFNVLLDNVADKMAHARTLLTIEIRNFKDSIAEDFKKEENKGQDEKPIDRKEVKEAPIDYDNVAKTVRKYEEENVLVAESILDKLEEKLGV